MRRPHLDPPVVRIGIGGFHSYVKCVEVIVNTFQKKYNCQSFRKRVDPRDVLNLA